MHSSLEPEVTSHVPAWRRLGLKLKNAQDSTNQPHNPVVSSQTTIQENGNTEKFRFGDELKNNVSLSLPSAPPHADNENFRSGGATRGARGVNRNDSQSHIRGASRAANSQVPQPAPEALPSTADSQTSDRISRKRKRHTVAPSENSISSNGFDTTPSTTRQDPFAGGSDSEESLSPSKSRRKSVAFTPDTKKEDGNSNQKLYGNLVASQADREVLHNDGVAGSSDVAHVNGQIEAEDSNTRTKVAERKAKKRQKRDEKQVSQPPDTPYVNYLQQFHTARDRWKFNKHQQNQLLKHIFNLHRVPEVHDPAIKAYITGLRGLSIRKRLRETALGALDPHLAATEEGSIDEQTMDDLQRHQRAKEKMLQERLRDHDRRRETGLPATAATDTRMQELKQRRAQVVLSALGEDHLLYPVQKFLVENANNGSISNSSTAPEADSERIKLNEQRRDPKKLRKQRHSGSSTGDSTSESSTSDSQSISSEEQSSSSSESTSSGSGSGSTSSERSSSVSESASSSHSESRSSSGSSSGSSASGSEGQDSDSGDASDDSAPVNDDNESSSSSSSSSSQ
ncbi:MAG: hypothetical protein M1821_007266 [Bathelium mastoideum]|nr:MAG: hypothetical protein M1821_007266 [Bathelium mastoideum]